MENYMQRLSSELQTLMNDLGPTQVGIIAMIVVACGFFLLRGVGFGR